MLILGQSCETHLNDSAKIFQIHHRKPNSRRRDVSCMISLVSGSQNHTSEHSCRLEKALTKPVTKPARCCLDQKVMFFQPETFIVGGLKCFLVFLVDDFSIVDICLSQVSQRSPDLFLSINSHHLYHRDVVRPWSWRGRWVIVPASLLSVSPDGTGLDDGSIAMNYNNQSGTGCWHPILDHHFTLGRNHYDNWAVFRVSDKSRWWMINISTIFRLRVLKFQPWPKPDVVQSCLKGYLAVLAVDGLPTSHCSGNCAGGEHCSGPTQFTQNGWFVTEHTMKMDDLGVPLFQEPRNSSCRSCFMTWQSCGFALHVLLFRRSSNCNAWDMF